MTDGLESASCTSQRRTSIRRKECQRCGDLLTEEEVGWYLGIRVDNPMRMCDECLSLEGCACARRVASYLASLESPGLDSGVTTDQDLVRFSDELAGMGARQYEWA